MKTNITSIVATVALAVASSVKAGESVKYCGIFINDEDWGLRQWAVKHFGKEQQIGIRAYSQIFPLMRKCGLNLLWPAMHEGGYEFASRPENFALAAEYGIRIGTSHCEPMLRNNCYLSKDDKKKWSWLKHKDFIRDYWQWSVDRYATNDVLWTIGMRGIHDGKMSDGETTAEKIAVLEDVFATQKGMLEAAGVGDAPTLFVPYKEVLPIFNAGLKVPKGTTIMWVNDNFGYIRRLGGPQCEGYGGGIYWHASYHGRPHGYIHLCTTPPAFMWYELVAKCAANGVRDVWMVNAGDVFQAEIIMYALGKFASDPDYWMTRPDAQTEILTMWVKEELGVRSEELGVRIVAHLNEYFNLGFIRKPEHMCVQWSEALPAELKSELLARYRALLEEDLAIEKELDSKICEAYFRAIGYQVQFFAHAGIIHLESRDKEYARSVIDPLTARWNSLDGGKWSGFWSDTIDERGGVRQPVPHNRWASQMQWPWNEPHNEDGSIAPRSDYIASSYIWQKRDGKSEPKWLEPESITPAADDGAWTRISGLGTSGKALALLPVKPGVGKGAAINLQLSEDAGGNKLILQFLPDFALWPGMALRVAVSFDGAEPVEVAVPKSDSNIGEKDPVRNAAVQDNFIRASVTIPPGAKSVKIIAIDPGVVIDRIGIQ